MTDARSGDDTVAAALEQVRAAARAGRRDEADAALAATVERWPDHPGPRMLDARLRREHLDFAGAAASFALAAERGSPPSSVAEREQVEALAATWPGPPTDDDLDPLLDVLDAELGGEPPVPATPGRWCVIHGALHTGGATRLIEEVVEVLLDAGREVVVLVSHLDGHGAAARASSLEARGVRVLLWGEPVDDRPTVLAELSRWGDVRPLGDRLRELRPGHVQVTGSALLLALAGTVARRATQADVVLRVGMEAPTSRARPQARAQAERNLVVRGLLRRLLADPRVRYDATSQRSQAGHQAWLGPEVTVGLVPALVDAGRLAAFAAEPIDPPWPEGALVLGGVMRLERVKRPDLFAEVAARVAAARPGVHVCLVGDGDRALLGEAPQTIGARWHHVGYQLRPEPWIAAMDVLLLTSSTEGMPTVVLEAGALGVPSVSADAGGAAEAMAHGRTGLIVEDVDDPDAYVAAVLALLDDDDRRRAMGAAAPAWIEARFGRDVVAPLLLEGADRRAPDA